MTLLASAPTVIALETLVNRFWYSTSYHINPETLAIQHPTKVPDGYRVTYVRGRYRFESNS